MKRIASAIVVCLFVLTLASCASMKKAQIVGTYDLVSASGSGINFTEKEINAMKALGMSATLVVREDGTASMDVYGEKLELTYDLNKMVFTAEGSDAKFTFDGSRISFSEDGTTLVFEKRK